MKKNRQVQFAEALLEHLQGDYGDTLEDVDALAILDAMGNIGIRFTDESDEASLAFIGVMAARAGRELK